MIQMAATMIDGKRIADEIRVETRQQTEVLKKTQVIVPGLGFILVGDDPASQSYVRSKGKACGEMGFHSVTITFPATVSAGEILDQIRKWNADPQMHGILVQLPLPKHLNEHVILEAIDYRKDVDGLHPVNVGRLVLGLPCLRPCTPAGVQEMLIRSGIDPAGKHVVVVGRSNIVGKPVANILLQKAAGANAVVTLAHTGGGPIEKYTRTADILVAAIGKPEMITGEMLKPGCVVIDVGINRIADATRPSGSRLVGDVHFGSASQAASAITPVPGGVGPMTIAMLMKNTLLAAGGQLYGQPNQQR
jgi:methylenetetrahydrofolate dehydrogenase (NADP+) / methenyltetrahydrofolate cyclohydrolase